MEQRCLLVAGLACWFLLAAVLLGIVLAVLWVGYAAHREKEERDFSAPLPGQER